MVIELIVIFVCLIGSAFFSASETAYNLANESQLEKKAESGFINKLSYKICKSYNFALTSILIGNNIVNFVLSSVATSLSLVLLVESGITGENVAATIATAVTTIVVLIFGEIAPKVIANGNSKLLIRAFALPLFFFMIVFSPAAYLINLIIKLVDKIYVNDDTGVTTDELSSIIETGEDEGSIDEDRSELLQSAIDFNETTIKEIMIPRVDMVSIDVGDGISEIIETALNSPFSRIPVYEDSVDNIIGILVVQKLYKALIDTKPEDIDLRELLVEPYFIHMTVKLPDALDVLREERTHIMIVLDEFGGTAGIATMEDILEELVGEIWDEDEVAEHDIVKAGPDKYSVEGDMNIYDFFEAIDFNEGDFESEYTTVGGWAIEMLEGFPEENASFQYENLVVTIDSIEDHRITKLTVTVKPIEEDEE
ncbi:MAG: HlyC/CorC family transporter [Clostridia bacterium]|nr:HlyC/CorC family transporter [Clostridia bacterium]